MATALRDVPPGSVVFVDDAQLLYEDYSLWMYLCKGSPVHVLAAATYSYEVPFEYASTPAGFGFIYSFFDVSPTLSECKSMESAILLNLEIEDTFLDAVSSQVAVRPPAGLEKPERRVYLGVPPLIGRSRCSCSTQGSPNHNLVRARRIYKSTSDTLLCWVGFDGSDSL